ncbi:NAD-dependent protein deacetylase sirtuin-3 isoform X2 [Clupea harengus]|uniref:NAD-dependent protein deacetylase sirtuin-3 isoform X2 n=1 Tax=Clupea harengus TaxID=7950 RepID=A0A6P8FAJ8_CLUHA|nr:NAD-dependent protein deacetylase sirtuin-3 isoform X2 [Clupea harengus]
MSKAKSSRDKRPTQPALVRVTRNSSTHSRQADSVQSQVSGTSSGPQAHPGGRQSDSGLVQDLSLMSVSEQKASAARGRPSKTGSSGTAGSLSGTQPQASPSIPKSGLGTIARLIKLGRLKNIVVVAGAGISTASGIPDFRTPGTGLYANLEKYNIPYPEAIFNIDYFSNDPRPFFSLAKELYPGNHQPNYVHYFIRMLHQKGLLLRMYTQNIDGLERMCGIPEDKLVEAHGSFETASCHLCYTPYPAEEAKRAIMCGSVPTCSFCQATVKPNVVFFGEDLPENYFQHTTDFPKADLLMIMGTSLQIEPFASLVNTVRPAVPRLLLNRGAVGPFERKPLRRGDYMELGDLSESVRRLAQVLGWHQEIEELMWGQENQCVPQLGTSAMEEQAAQGRRGVEVPPGRWPKTSSLGATGARSGSEESDASETDSMSTESSGPSN